MSKRDLRAIARHLIGKVLELKVAAKNIEIEDYEENDFPIPSYLVFSIKNADSVIYILREQKNGKYKFYINKEIVCELELSDFEVE